ncbi:hypothetical protein GUJ93_ZPchr0458g22721 [Zizania palustris]|uniref:CRIB domain-containing protein n=1 Tax=Zizania palustris TaxID=103762 RepID=A0A8J5RDX4_ZIZPA|nr:hypothetical protein GUJ93_ZPchr0458g22721 [Zizania palustris]
MFLGNIPNGVQDEGIFKGIKAISQIFAVKEHEIEIGNPTDVKHVAHIGWDNPTWNASPSWMNDIRTSSDFCLWATLHHPQGPLGLLKISTSLETWRPLSHIQRTPACSSRTRLRCRLTYQGRR